MRIRSLALVALAIVGCGGQKWTDADARNATDACHVELTLETLCAPGAACEASQVRALERAAYCASSSQLHRHAAPVPSSSITCQP